MPQRTTRRSIATVNYQANQVVPTQLLVSGSVRALVLTMDATLNNTNNTSQYAYARNPGTLIPNIHVYANRDITLKQGSWNDWRTRMYCHYKLPAETADTNAVNATAINSTIIIPFITPGGRRPVDTALNTAMFQRVDIDIQFGDESSILNAGAKAWTVNPTVKIEAIVSRNDPPPIALYKEFAIDTDPLGTTANTGLEIPLVRGIRRNYHHMILETIDTVANTGDTLVSTALNSVKLEQIAAGEATTPYGPLTGAQMQSSFDLQASTVDGIQTGIYPIPFQQQFDGMKNFNLRTAGLSDLRLMVDHAAFTTAGKIRVLQGTVEEIGARG